MVCLKVLSRSTLVIDLNKTTWRPISDNYIEERLSVSFSTKLQKNRFLDFGDFNISEKLTLLKPL